MVNHLLRGKELLPWRMFSEKLMWLDILPFFLMCSQQDEPFMKPGLAEQKNAVVVPHIASASKVRTQREKISIYIAIFFVLNLVLATNPTFFIIAVQWTREGMATLAALNVLVSLGKIKGYPIWSDPNRVEPFLDENSPAPAACPSIVNAKQLGI
ncbi:hypothetical protein BHE74_00029986 [Ensete ventricosum]|nr:hypothetical protein BHE74_00029986 [Ensete ventricosum]RZR93902.1 hypothetical protein BHM03_00022510 [Ensete ventricosum]